jgi:ligand-binding SRPBCC domain-containing protein
MFMLKFLVCSSVLVVSTFTAETKGDCDISGMWNHSVKPATLLVDLSKGEISVHSHDDNAKAIGLAVIKGIMPVPNASSWNAKMYSADEDSFVDVQIKSNGCNQLSVDFQGEEVLKLVR